MFKLTLPVAMIVFLGLSSSAGALDQEQIAAYFDCEKKLDGKAICFFPTKETTHGQLAGDGDFEKYKAANELPASVNPDSPVKLGQPYIVSGF